MHIQDRQGHWVTSKLVTITPPKHGLIRRAATALRLDSWTSPAACQAAMAAAVFNALRSGSHSATENNMLRPGSQIQNGSNT